jgi:hypothetical protein
MKITKEDRITSDYIRLKAGFKCARCGAYHPDCRGLHASHYMGRINQATRYEEDNLDCLCYGCHSYLEERKQTEYRDFKIKQLGEMRVEEIEFKSRGVKKWKVGEKEAIIEKYKIWILKNK